MFTETDVNRHLGLLNPTDDDDDRDPSGKGVRRGQ
jgi:hypothetical protein